MNGPVYFLSQGYFNLWSSDPCHLGTASVLLSMDSIQKKPKHLDGDKALIPFFYKGGLNGWLWGGKRD